MARRQHERKFRRGNAPYQKKCGRCGMPVIMRFNGLDWSICELGHGTVTHQCVNGPRLDDPRRVRFGN